MISLSTILIPIIQITSIILGVALIFFVAKKFKKGIGLYVSLLLIRKGLSFVLIFYVPLIRNLQRRLSALLKGCRNGPLHWREESRRIVIILFIFLSVRNFIGINKQLCIQSPINKKEILHL